MIKCDSDLWGGLWFSLGTLASSTNKTDSHDIIHIIHRNLMIEQLRTGDELRCSGIMKGKFKQ